MVKENKGIAAKLAAVGVISLVAGAGIATVAIEPEVKEVVVNKTVEYVNVTEEVIVEVPVNVTVEKIVEVDNGDMKFVLDRLEDKALIEDAEEIVSELKAEDEALSLALSVIDTDDMAEELEDADIVADERDVKVVKVFDDFEDINITRSDFDRENYKFEIKLIVEDIEEEKDIDVVAEVEVLRGGVQIKSVTKI